MFQFTAFPSVHYGFMHGYLRFAQVGFPIQKSPDRWLFAPPRSLSQLTTSFFASKSQGIPHTLLFTFFYDHLNAYFKYEAFSHLLNRVNEQCKLSSAKLNIEVSLLYALSDVDFVF